MSDGVRVGVEMVGVEGEQGWHTGENACLPPVWSGFKAGPVPYVG